MLTRYVETIMKDAIFEPIEDEPGMIWGELPGIDGVWARARSEAECRNDLQEALEEWMLYRFQHSLPLPVVHGIDLSRAA
jgi:predicted RNase H-like HicB family nuclease